MSLIKFLTITLFFLGVLSLGAETQTKKKLTSKVMLEYNPLLSGLEPVLWKKLIEFEKKAGEGDKDSQKKFILLADEITKKHPLLKTQEYIKLGGVKLDLKSKTIEIEAKVNYCDFIELVLCNDSGRKHESMFLTDARPLHLETILHLAGFSKGKSSKAFSVYVSNGKDTLPVKELLKLDKNLAVPSMKWNFAGCEFKNGEYFPDVAGEHILLWSRHKSVMLAENVKVSTGELEFFSKKHPAFPHGKRVKIQIKPE